MLEKIPHTLRVATEKAAVSVLPMFGKLDKHQADLLAVESMRKSLQEMDLHIRVVIGEGEKDDAPMLFEGEVLGKEGAFAIDIAVDPLECTTNFAKGLPNSMSVIAFADRGGLHPIPGTYMEQWLAGPEMKEPFEPEKGIRYNINKLADAIQKKPAEMLIVVQDRPRHDDMIKELRAMGCGISLISAGSISTAMDIFLQTGIYDAMLGTYGAPEGLICAAMAVATGSEMKGLVKPHTPELTKKWSEMGGQEGVYLDKNKLVHGKHVGLVATGISGNHFLKGLQQRKDAIHGYTLIISTDGIGMYNFHHSK
ncbi:MAG: fructose-bisphosphatase class II [Spirochaetota bacterium]